MVFFKIRGYIVKTSNYYPSLSEDGWVNGSIKTADYILSDFFLSDYSQSYIYSGHIASLSYILQSTQGNVLVMLNKLRESLLGYFNNYFNNTLVDVKDVTKPETPSKLELSIFLTFDDSDGVTYSLGKLLEINNLTINKIININNG
jgi:hypothetical protein